MSSLQNNVGSGTSEDEVNPIVGAITSLKEKHFWGLYNPTKKLGSGAFGSVVAAVRVKDELPVAVKTLKRFSVPYGIDENGKTVPREVLILSKVANVDGAIHMLDWTQTEDKVFIVMELPPGCLNLGEYLSAYGFVPQFVAREMVRQIATTIIEMQAVNVLHRDLKLENVLVEKETGNLKIIDFGLTTKFCSLNQTSRACMGTSRYHAPEMFERKTFIAGPGMVWALGVITFSLLTGKVPFRSGPKKNSRKLKFPAQVSNAPLCLDFVKKCFIRDPENRIPLDKLASHPWLDVLSNPSGSESPLAAMLNGSEDPVEFSTQANLPFSRPLKRKRESHSATESESHFSYPQTPISVTEEDDISEDIHSSGNNSLAKDSSVRPIAKPADVSHFPFKKRKPCLAEFEAAEALLSLYFSKSKKGFNVPMSESTEYLKGGREF